MSKYAEKISDNSVWVTATPTTVTDALPFYAIEAGHFIAQRDYSVSREFHDSRLLLYTISGAGVINTQGSEIVLAADNAVIIDCRKPHSYHSKTDEWEFMWLHTGGAAAHAMADILYPGGAARAVSADAPQRFIHDFKELTELITGADVISGVEASARIHSLYNRLIRSALENENAARSRAAEIDAALEFIHGNYSKNITIDDMLNSIHMSKYHFIRTFRRVMGATPYSYLTVCRINEAKRLLRATSKSIGDIAAECGFTDTSNFIAHFKKRTGVNPTRYRRESGVILNSPAPKKDGV